MSNTAAAGRPSVLVFGAVATSNPTMAPAVSMVRAPPGCTSAAAAVVGDATTLAIPAFTCVRAFCGAAATLPPATAVAFLAVVDDGAPVAARTVVAVAPATVVLVAPADAAAEVVVSASPA